MPDDQTIVKTGRRAKLIGIISAALIAATPGIYSAWENAKQAYRISHEQKIRDSQEVDLQKWAKANKAEIDALKHNCVTHKELLEIMLTWRRDRTSRWTRNTREDRPSAPLAGPTAGGGTAGPPAPEDAAVGDLQRRIDNQRPAPKVDYPELKPADRIRQTTAPVF